jgi:hypothetical protein
MWPTRCTARYAGSQGIALSLAGEDPPGAIFDGSSTGCHCVPII